MNRIGVMQERLSIMLLADVVVVVVVVAVSVVVVDDCSVRFGSHFCLLLLFELPALSKAAWRLAPRRAMASRVKSLLRMTYTGSKDDDGSFNEILLQ
jgi:hypothetical protein